MNISIYKNLNLGLPPQDNIFLQMYNKILSFMTNPNTIVTENSLKIIVMNKNVVSHFSKNVPQTVMENKGNVMKITLPLPNVTDVPRIPPVFMNDIAIDFSYATNDSAAISAIFDEVITKAMKKFLPNKELVITTEGISIKSESSVEYPIDLNARKKLFVRTLFKHKNDVKKHGKDELKEMYKKAYPELLKIDLDDAKKHAALEAAHRRLNPDQLVKYPTPKNLEGTEFDTTHVPEKLRSLESAIESNPNMIRSDDPRLIDNGPGFDKSGEEDFDEYVKKHKRFPDALLQLEQRLTKHGLNNLSGGDDSALPEKQRLALIDAAIDAGKDDLSRLFNPQKIMKDDPLLIEPIPGYRKTVPDLTSNKKILTKNKFENSSGCQYFVHLKFNHDSNLYKTHIDKTQLYIEPEQNNTGIVNEGYSETSDQFIKDFVSEIIDGFKSYLNINITSEEL